MSGQARPPRQGIVTYPRKSTTARLKLLKRQLTKQVLAIQEPEDPKTSESEDENAGKMRKELRPKYKQPLVQLTRAHPFNVFRLSNSDEESYSKAMTESETSQEVVHQVQVFLISKRQQVVDKFPLQEPADISYHP